MVSARFLPHPPLIPPYRGRDPKKRVRPRNKGESLALPKFELDASETVVAVCATFKIRLELGIAGETAD